MQEEIDAKREVLDFFVEKRAYWEGQMRYSRSRLNYLDKAIAKQKTVLVELIKEKEEQCQSQQVLKD